MDSDRRSSGELVIDEDAIMGSPCNELSEPHTLTNSKDVKSKDRKALFGAIRKDQNGVEKPPTKSKKMKRRPTTITRTPATKRALASMRDPPPIINNTRAINGRPIIQLTKKLHYFKLSTLKDLKSTSLSISAKLHQFYNMQLYLLPQNTLAAEVLIDYPMAPPLEEISLEQLLNWPGVGIVLCLSDMTYTRRIVPHCEHSIVFGSDPRINLDLTDNVSKVRRYVTVKTQKPGPQISNQVFETYISAIEATIQLIDVSKSRSAELLTILRTIKEDINPVKSLCAKTPYSRYLNRPKYMRIFNNESDQAKKHQLTKTFLRETINPEVLFEIERCTFLNEKRSVWETDLTTFFENLFIRKDQRSMNSLKDSFKKCISFICLICNKTFDGVLCMYATKAHLATHFHNKNWSCTKCNQSWSQFEITKDGWFHRCNTR